MDDQALLKRIDRHLYLQSEYMREGHEYMRQGNEHMRQGNEYMREGSAVMARQTQVIEDLRLAMNQWNLRQEKMTRAVLTQLQELTESTRAHREDGIEEARAQRAALLAILDEMRGGGPAPTAG